MTRCWVLPWNGIVGHVIQQYKDVNVLFLLHMYLYLLNKTNTIRNKNNKIR